LLIRSNPKTYAEIPFNLPLSKEEMIIMSGYVYIP
jgi:hypothetical protein